MKVLVKIEANDGSTAEMPVVEANQALLMKGDDWAGGEPVGWEYLPFEGRKRIIIEVLE